MRFAHLCLFALVLAAGTPACANASLSLNTGGVKINYAVKGMTLTLKSWQTLAAATGGVTYESKASADMPELVGQAMMDDLPPGVPVDIVFVVDTTGSMQDDIDAVKAKLTELIDSLAASNADYECAVVAYRDVGDDYVSKLVQPLTNDRAAIQSAIASLAADGGNDWREHVYAGLDTALREPAWRPGTTRRIILIGDAPPHEDYSDDPRNHDSSVALARERGVRVNAIGVYCDSTCQAGVSSGDDAGKP